MFIIDRYLGEIIKKVIFEKITLGRTFSIYNTY